MFVFFAPLILLLRNEYKRDKSMRKKIKDKVSVE